MPKLTRKKITLHPIMTFCLLLIFTILLSGILGLIDVSADFNTFNAVRGDIDTKTVSVVSLLTLSGLKLIFRTTVYNFVTFPPLSMLIITLIGIGIMDKSGFLEAFFTLITKKASKFRVTLTLSFITVIASLIGELSYIVLIPITALFFKYSKRNPKAGIVLAFAGLTTGSAINIFMNSIDSALMESTRIAASSLDASYTINSFAYLFVMIPLTIIMSFIIAIITERVIVPRFGKYEESEEVPEVYLDKNKRKGLTVSLIIGGIYLLIFIYNIIPGLPLSGNLLDYTQTYYIDKLFGSNSFFNQGFVFVVTIWFFLLGLSYGLTAKTIKNNRDMSEYLGHSLDGIGKTLVLIFFASTLISVFKNSNIGIVVVALVANFLSTTSMTGIPLIIVTFILVALTSLLVPSPLTSWMVLKKQITSWTILSNVIIPVFMNAGMSAEFATLVFRAANSITYGITPLMAYYVIYLAFLDNYSEEDKPISLFTSIKELLPYAGTTAVVWIIVLILFYIIGLSLGIDTPAVL